MSKKINLEEVTRNQIGKIFVTKGQMPSAWGVYRLLGVDPIDPDDSSTPNFQMRVRYMAMYQRPDLASNTSEHKTNLYSWNRNFIIFDQKQQDRLVVEKLRLSGLIDHMTNIEYYKNM